MDERIPDIAEAARRLCQWLEHLSEGNHNLWSEAARRLRQDVYAPLNDIARAEGVTDE